MKYVFQWKDPDYDDGEPLARHGAGSDVERYKLRQLGIGEYVVIEVDTEAMTTTVRKRS